jgi:hypothetical protein
MGLAGPARPVAFVWPFVFVPMFVALDLALRGAPGGPRSWCFWARVLACTVPVGMLMGGISGDWVEQTAYVFGGLPKPLALIGSAGLNFWVLPLHWLLYALVRAQYDRGWLPRSELAALAGALALAFGAAYGYGAWRLGDVAAGQATGARVQLVGIQPNFSLMGLASTAAGGSRAGHSHGGALAGVGLSGALLRLSAGAAGGGAVGARFGRAPDAG